MTALESVPRRWSILSLTALIGIVALPSCVCLFVWGARWQSPAAGALLWLIAVCIKRWLNPALSRRLVSRAILTRASSQGLLSAVLELGAAACYFAFSPDLSLVNVVAFGAGAGSAEAAYVLGLGFFGPQPTTAALDAWAQGAATSLCVRYMVPIERFFALVGHTGSRGLVYLALYSPAPTAGLLLSVAVLLFALIDGVAVYGHLQNWDWFDPVICRRAHLFFSSLSTIEALLFVLMFGAKL